MSAAYALYYLKMKPYLSGDHGQRSRRYHSMPRACIYRSWCRPTVVAMAEIRYRGAISPRHCLIYAPKIMEPPPVQVVACSPGGQLTGEFALQLTALPMHVYTIQVESHNRKTRSYHGSRPICSGRTLAFCMCGATSDKRKGGGDYRLMLCCRSSNGMIRFAIRRKHETRLC